MPSSRAGMSLIPERPASGAASSGSRHYGPYADIGIRRIGLWWRQRSCGYALFRYPGGSERLAQSGGERRRAIHAGQLLG